MRRDIDADRRRNFRICRSVALRCIDLGRSFELFGSSAELQKLERQIRFSVYGYEVVKISMKAQTVLFAKQQDD